MKAMRRHVICAVVVSVLAAAHVRAQTSLPPQQTRFTVGFGAMLSQPKEDFRNNIGGNLFGGGGSLLYHIDRPGWLSLRLDGSGLGYGSEKKRVPFSETVGARVLTDVTTSNSIAGFSVGPEFTVPRGFVRPYVNVAFSGLFFRTRSSVDGTDSSEESVVSTTNYKDNAAAWVYGGGIRIPVTRSTSLVRASLDFGVRYHRGGEASYLRKGSIQDNPDGTISFSPLHSRTPYMVYVIGAQFRIPFNSLGTCPKFLC